MTQNRRLTFGQQFAYAMGNLCVSLTPWIIGGWLIYFYTGQDKKFISTTVCGLAMFIGRLGDALANPFVGYFSDRMNSRWGRRMPFLIFGAPFFTLTFILMWFPISSQPGLANSIYLSFILFAYWVVYVAVVAPYLSLLPEITPYNEERIKISVYMSIFDVLAMIIGSVAIGIFVDRMREGVNIAGIFIPDGFKVMAIVIGLITGISVYMPVLKIKETPYSESKAVPFSFFDACKHSFKNPSFLPYVISISFYRIAIDVVVAAIPFMVTRVMGQSEEIAGYLQGAIVIAAAFLFVLVDKMATKLGKKRIFLYSIILFAILLPLIATIQYYPFLGKLVLWGGKSFKIEVADSLATEKLIHGFILFLLFSAPIAVVFVVPRAIFADIVDHDEQLTGYRREAMYNGMEGLITKFAAALAPVITTQLFQWFGSSSDNPGGIILTGPISALLLMAGYFAFKSYPFEK